MSTGVGPLDVIQGILDMYIGIPDKIPSRDLHHAIYSRGIITTRTCREKVKLAVFCDLIRPFGETDYTINLAAILSRVERLGEEVYVRYGPGEFDNMPISEYVREYPGVVATRIKYSGEETV